MAKNGYGEVVQAMPIKDNTFIGIATNQNPNGGTIQMLADGDITFIFGLKSIALTNINAGQNFQADIGCTGITSTANIIIT